MNSFNNQKKRLKSISLIDRINTHKLKSFLRTPKTILAWEHILVAFAFTLGIAPITYSVTQNISQKYSQLISGSLAWSANDKLQDYILLFSIVTFFFIAYLTVYCLSCLIIQNKGQKAEKAFRVLLALSTLPTWLWVSSLFLNQDLSFSNLLFLPLSAVMAILVVVFSSIAAIKKLKFTTEREFIDCVGTTILIIIGTALTSIGVALAIGRINLDWQLQSPKQTVILAVAVALIAFLGMIFIWLSRSHTVTHLLKTIRRLVLLVQVFMPACFLLLIPTPWQTFQGKIYGYPIRPSLYWLIGILIGLAYYDLGRRVKFRSTDPISPIKFALSPLCLTGLLFLLKLPIIPIASISTDDYHTGEFLLPWWLWKDFGYIPFQDYYPARGLVNYLPGWLADVFFDGTASSEVAANSIRAFIFLGIGFWVISRSIGVMPAFLAFLLMLLANGVSEIDILLVVVLCILCEFFLHRKPTLWLAVWVILGTGLFLFAPGQAGLLLISTLPLVVVALWGAFSQEKMKLLYYCIGGVFLAILLSWLTPIARITIGAWRYLKEQSAINSIAHGVAWSESFGKLETWRDINYWLWEAIRSSWIVVALIAGLLIWRALFQSNWRRHKRLLVFAVPIAILVVLFIPRAAGRIDSGNISRLGLASIWSLSLLLPILLLTAYNYLQKPIVMLIWAFASGIFAPLTDLSKNIFQQPSAVSSVRGAFTDGTQMGLPHIGNAIVDSEQLQRLRSIKLVLDKILEPGETFLDLTSHNARYFYLGYPPPIEVGAVYNLVHNNQQLRALQQLQKNPSPIVLAFSDDIFLADGGTVAFRSPLIYRYVVENYIPVKIDRFIYMIKPDRLARLGYSQVIRDNEKQLSLLDTAFRQQYLNALPIAWGQSYNTLRSQLRVISQAPATVSSLHSVRYIGENNYEIIGDNPSITFNLASKIDGRDAGVLAFDFSCDHREQRAQIEINWSSQSSRSNAVTSVTFQAEEGKLLVPMDAEPRWLLAKGINSIHFKFIQPIACKTFSITNVTLLQRSTISQIDATKSP